MKKFLLVGFVGLATVFFVGTVFAADSTKISISPLTFDLSANPGDALSNELRVTNGGSEPVVVTVEAQDFVAKGEEGEVALTDQKSTYSLASWVELASEPVTLQPGKSENVKFVIRVPYNAEPGGHYASVFAHISPTLEAAKSGSYIGQKIASLVLLKVSGQAKEEAVIESFTTAKGVYQKGPVDLNLRIKNNGSLHIRPKGIVAVTDMFGKKVADISVEQLNVLPGATRKMKAEWKNPPFFGKFNATVLAYYGAENKQITAITSFWVIPVKTLLIWGGLVLVLVVFAYIGRVRIRKALKALFGK